jgi:hypothetical protein
LTTWPWLSDKIDASLAGALAAGIPIPAAAASFRDRGKKPLTAAMSSPRRGGGLHILFRPGSSGLEPRFFREESMRVLWPTLLLSVLIASSAEAQNWRACCDPNNKATRVTANFQVNMPVSSGASAADMTAALAQANQQLYEIVNRQCDVIAAALKGECRIVQLNVNGNVNERMNAGQMINANANLVFEVQPPSSPKDGPAAKESAPAAQ